MNSDNADFKEFQKWKESQKPVEKPQEIKTEEIKKVIETPIDNNNTQVYVVNPETKNLTLFVHLMSNKNHEVTSIKKKTYDTEFDWNKRTFNVHPEMFITYKNGEVHYYHDINDTYGGLSFNKSHIEQCNKCGKSLSKDSQISYNLTRKRNLTGIWGVDNQHMILLMIMGIGLMLALVAVFYIIGGWQETQKQLDVYLPKTPQTAHFIIGGIINYASR